MFPLEIHLDTVAWLGFFMFAPTILFFLIGLILLLTKQKKPGKVFMIMAGCCLLIALGLCGVGIYQ